MKTRNRENRTERSIRAALALIMAAGLAVAAHAEADYGTDSVFSMGTGSRALSMGNAFTAVADDSSAVFFNPAGLVMLPKQQAALLHYPLYEGALYNSATYGQPILDVGAFGAAFYRAAVDGIEMYDANDYSSGTTKYEQFKATASYANSLSDALSIGFNINVFNMSMLSVSAMSFGADIGALYTPFSFVRLGVMAHNIVNPSLAMREEKEDLPRCFTLGMALFYDSDAFGFTLSSDLGMPENAAMKVRGGAEISLLRMLSIRGGYDDSRISFGGGIKAFDVALDYAMSLNDYMGSLSRFTVSYSFGLTLPEQAEERKKALREQVKKLIEEEFRKKEQAKAKVYYESALQLFAKGKGEEALAELDNAFEWNENYEEAKALKGRIEKRLGADYYDAGVSRYNKADYVSALENFRKARKVSPGYKETEDYIRKLDEKMKMKGAAKEDFSKGVEHYVNGRYQDAIRSFNAALQSEPGNEMIRSYLAKAKVKSQAGKASSGGRALTAEQTESVRKLYYAGLKSYTNGDLKAAVASWKEALNINPSDIKILKSIEKAQAELAELQKRGIK